MYWKRLRGLLRCDNWPDIWPFDSNDLACPSQGTLSSTGIRPEAAAQCLLRHSHSPIRGSHRPWTPWQRHSEPTSLFSHYNQEREGPGPPLTCLLTPYRPPLKSSKRLSSVRLLSHPASPSSTFQHRPTDRPTDRLALGSLFLPPTAHKPGLSHFPNVNPFNTHPRHLSISKHKQPSNPRPRPGLREIGTLS